MNKNEIIKVATEQLAKDMNCSPIDFFAANDIVVSPAIIEGRRHFFNENFYFHMATFGKNAVVSTNKKMHLFMKWILQASKITKKNGFYLFTEPVLIKIGNELKKHNQNLFSSIHSYLPYNYHNMGDLSAIRESIEKNNIYFKWMKSEDIPHLYYDKRFENALLYDINPKRLDTLAYVAMDKFTNKPVGVAGASGDSATMWQIGIDVLEKYRGLGIATYLVICLKEEIFKRGKIPYYSTNQSNILSQNIAFKAGFFPAWVEINS